MFEVRVNGALLSNLEEVEISENIETILTEYMVRHYDQDVCDLLMADPRAVIEFFWNGEKLKKCYVDVVKDKKTKSGREFTFSGRSSLCDIVDSNVETVAFKDTQYASMVKKLTSPYQIKVIDNGRGNQKIEDAHFDEKDSVFDAVNKYTGQFKIILDEGSDGELVFTKKSDEIVGIYTESDFEEIAFTKNNDELYSTYHLVSNGSTKAEVKAKDDKIRNRYFFEQVEDLSKEVIQKIVDSRMEVRKTESENISIPSIIGFEFKDGSRVRTNVNIRLITDRADSIFLVTGYKVTANKETISTTLEIKRRDAYDLREEEGIYDQ